MNNNVFKRKKGYISFYIVLVLLLIISIFMFIIMLHISVSIPSNLNQQISMAVASMTIRNINSLLSAKAENYRYSNFSIPIIDLLIAATFFDSNKYSIMESILSSTKWYYEATYSIDFNYCTDVYCSKNCEFIYIFPTAYGYIRMCDISFESTFGYGRECGQ